ncbi:MAG: glycosyltransferase [Pyrinomonadaceae bacterium]|nr:glycosyltransferase [Pyrinomonadaceae bacterium]
MQPGHTLYLCYFGLLEPLVQTQVLPYLREIKKLDGLQISFLTFEPHFKEKWGSAKIEKEKRKLASEGINWHALPYHKSPSVPATLFDIINGTRFVRKLIKEQEINVLHARVHVPALMGALAATMSRKKIKLIFDIRGFFPEEYTDAGNWKKNGLIYKSVKRAERWLLRKSDGFVVLTEKAREILFPESRNTGFDKFGRPVEVIPCCVDLNRFEIPNNISRQEIRQKYNLYDRNVIAYVGSLGTWYLADEMADLMQTAREGDDSTFALILTQSSPKIMFDKLIERGFSDRDFLIKNVSHEEIPNFLTATDIAVSFIKPCFSKLSSSPTKIAEYLASGVPIITNRGVGDVAEHIEEDRTGAVVDNFNRESYRRALREIGDLKKRTELSVACRLSARKRFDLEQIGGSKYRLIYEKMLERI